MYVLRVMRAFTKRQKNIKFSGCYHGHANMYPVEAGFGVLTFGSPDSPGVPKSSTETTLVAKYNDVESVRALLEANKGEFAGVILEHVEGNSGFIPRTMEFLQDSRKVTEEHGTLLCFNKVMTGFCVSYAGAQGILTSNWIFLRLAKSFAVDFPSVHTVKDKIL